MDLDLDNEPEPTEQEVEEALDSLVEKGFLEKVIMADGKPGYKPTMDGELFMKHSNSDPDKRN